MANITIAANPVLARIMECDDDLKLEISELLSYQIPGAEHSAAFKAGSWSGRSTLFGYARATFPAGMITLVASFLTQKGHRVQLQRKPAPAPLGLANPEVDTFGVTAEYKYQFDTVDQLLKHRAIIAQIATGGGKSRIAALAFAKINRPTLFLTTRSVLMHQMKRAFNKSIKHRLAKGELDLYGVKCGVLGDSEWSLNRLVNVAMVQTIQAKLKDPATEEKMRAVLEHFELVILEEAHESSGNGYHEIMSLCKNAHYRLALTATPFMRDDEEANMRLMAVSGPIGIKVSEKELIDKGILATPQFKIVECPPPARVKKLTNWQLAYQIAITQGANRNAIIAREVKSACGHDMTAMVLVQRREHGLILEALFKADGLKVKYIFGDSDQEERTKALKDLEERNIDVLIGSTILDVGVDVPSVDLIVLAGAGKAEVALRQRIGRGLRKKPSHKPNKAYILEFRDTLNKHLAGHSEQRRQILESTPGFAENILPPGVDFDFKRK